MPRMSFDIVDRCNLRCPACYHGLYGSASKEMELNVCERALEHCTEVLEATHVYPYNWGDPLLSRNLLAFVNLFGRFGVQITLSSNMNARVDDATVEGILSHVHAFKFSISGLSQTTYELYHRGGRIERVMRNVERFLAARDRLSSQTEFIWVFGQHTGNAADRQQIEHYCAQNGITFVPARYYVTNVEDVYAIWRGQKVDRMMYELFCDSQEEVRNEVAARLTPNYCALLRDIVVDCDANLMTCCAGNIKLGVPITEVKSLDELVSLRLNNRFCRSCAEVGLSGYFGVRASVQSPGYHLPAD